MSEINGDAHRTRRRASRSAGPPVEDASAVTEKVTERVGAAAVTSAGSAGTAKGVSAESASSVQGADSVSQEVSSKRADSVELTKDASAGSADSVELAKGVSAGSNDSVELAKGEASDAGSADSAKDSDSAGSPSVDLVKSEAAKQADADETAADSGDSDDVAVVNTVVRRARVLAVAAASVLILVLGTGAVYTTFTANAAEERAERRTEYVQTARQAILNLTTIRADSAKEDIDRILSLASGPFKTEFDGRVDPFLSIVQQAKVVSNGEIVEAAVESDTDESAKVLVAAKQTLTNAGQAEPQTRYYRFRVTVSRTDSGLTASNVEFVP